MSKTELDKPQQSGVISHDEESIAISESGLLVPLTKSKKLAVIRKRSQSLHTVEINPVHSDEIPVPGLNKEVNKLLNDAREQINAKINEIMALYPPGKKNKMFTLRYGSPESIKQMNMKAIFTHLHIAKAGKFALIENLDYFGNDTRSKKSGFSQ